MTIHTKLARLTELCNKSAVSSKAGLSETYLHGVIARHTNISASSAAKLARVLGVDIGWLLDDTRGWPPVRVEYSDAVSNAAPSAA